MSSQGALLAGDTASQKPGHGAKHYDSPLMYCSYFAYCENGLRERIVYTEKIKVQDVAQKLRNAESKSNFYHLFCSFIPIVIWIETKILEEGTAAVLEEFLNMSDHE